MPGYDANMYGMQLFAKLHQITRDTYILTVYRVYGYDYQSQNS